MTKARGFPRTPNLQQVRPTMSLKFFNVFLLDPGTFSREPLTSSLEVAAAFGVAIPDQAHDMRFLNRPHKREWGGDNM